jgi:hypothetical protein
MSQAQLETNYSFVNKNCCVVLMFWTGRAQCITLYLGIVLLHFPSFRQIQIEQMKFVLQKSATLGSCSSSGIQGALFT